MTAAYRCRNAVYADRVCDVVFLFRPKRMGLLFPTWNVQQQRRLWCELSVGVCEMPRRRPDDDPRDRATPASSFAFHASRFLFGQVLRHVVYIKVKSVRSVRFSRCDETVFQEFWKISLYENEICARMSKGFLCTLTLANISTGLLIFRAEHTSLRRVVSIAARKYYAKWSFAIRGRSISIRGTRSTYTSSSRGFNGGASRFLLRALSNNRTDFVVSADLGARLVKFQQCTFDLNAASHTRWIEKSNNKMWD